MIYILIASAVARTRLIEGHILPSAIDGQTFHLHQARRIFEAVDMFWECMNGNGRLVQMYPNTDGWRIYWASW